MEIMIVGVVAVLLFGNRLPEVGRSLGKGLIEFKKGLRENE
jgi:sec-independent protein translocase protein TatA